MQRFILQTVLVFFSYSLSSQTLIEIPSGEKCIEIISFKKKVLIVTDKNISSLEGKILKPIYASNLPIISAKALQNNIIVLKKESIDILNNPTLVKTKSIALNETISKNVIGLRCDSTQQKVFLITHDEGIYEVADGQLKPFLTSNNVNDALFISSTDYWLATQSGLGHQTGKRYVRYVEESITGSSIPDNMVEHLHRTPDNRLIVQMAEALSVFELAGDKTEGHGADLDFIGQKGNQIFDICGLPKGFTLFATEKGLMLAGKNALEHEPDGGLKEVFSPKNKKAYRIKPSELGLGASKNENIERMLWDGRKSVYLSTANSIVVVPLKKILE